MLGYVQPLKPELKIREYEIYRAYYCGVCRSMRKRLGQTAGMVLGYEFAFLAMLLSAIKKEGNSVSRKRCIVHPVNKRLYINEDDFIEYSSDMNILLAYYNLKDKWKDDRSIKALAALAIINGSFKKIRNKYGRICDIIEKSLHELDKLERNCCDSIDRASEPFAKIMEAVLAEGEGESSDNADKKALGWMGYNLGKWIYLIDAFDDMEQDQKHSRYNPLLAKYNNGEINIEEARATIKNMLLPVLTQCLAQISKAFELLDIKENREIIENIIYAGLMHKTDQILLTGSCKDIEKSI